MEIQIKKILRFVFLLVVTAAAGVFFTDIASAQDNVPTITRDLTVGTKGVDVQGLQQFLNASNFTIALSGPGSLGHETSLFGNATKAALAKFQRAHGITATGYFGAKTRAYLAKLLKNGSAVTAPDSGSSVATDKNSLLREQIDSLQRQLTGLLSLTQPQAIDTVPPAITAINVTLSNTQYIGIGDTFSITFSEPIDPKSVNSGLALGGSVAGVTSSQTGGASVSASGEIIINGIADFTLGSAHNPGNFGANLILDSTGKILTVNLSSGNNVSIGVKNPSKADQIGGTIKDGSGNTMQSASQAIGLGGSFGTENGTSFIDAINVSNGGKSGYVDDSDSITITFDQPIDPKSVNSSLYNGGSVSNVDYSQTGGVTVSSSGQVTINGIVDFNLGSVGNSGSFATRLALNPTGKILTVTLVNGLDIRITTDNFAAADQIGGTVKDINGNVVAFESSVATPTGTFGGTNINAGSVPYITAINISNGGKIGYIDDGDAIAITFNEAIDPKSINGNLGDGVTIPSVQSNQTGGVSVASSGQVTVNGIADFNIGVIENSGLGNFMTKISLDSAGRILTVLLTNGNDIAIDNENITSVNQVGGTIKDLGGNIMASVAAILTPTGTFGGQIVTGSSAVSPYIVAINVANGGDSGYIDDGDSITITFSEPVNPKSINSGLVAGDYVINVPYSQTGGVSVTSSGEVTVNGIADFYMGSVSNSTDFTVQVALESTGRAMTVTLADGGSAQITNEAFSAAYQVGGIIKDISGNKMVAQTAILVPAGTFGGKY